MKKDLKKKYCQTCQQEIKEGFLHICGNDLSVGRSERTTEEQKQIYKKDTLQPYTKEGKVNDDFIKAYGKDKHPKYNKELAKEMKQASKH